MQQHDLKLHIISSSGVFVWLYYFLSSASEIERFVLNTSFHLPSTLKISSYKKKS